jgi:MoxR-like ATPase
LHILNRTTGSKKADVKAVITAEEITQAQELVRQVTINEDLTRYVSNIIRATRPDTTTVAYIKEWVRWGAGPRAGQALILTAKARALLKGRYSVLMEDIQAMAPAVLRHRILMNFKAEAEGINSDRVTEELLKVIERKGSL